MGSISTTIIDWGAIMASFTFGMCIIFIYILLAASYHASWDTNQGKMTWHEARDYCASRGEQIISLDTAEKARRYLDILTASGRDYFWTGGKLNNVGKLDGRTLVWPSGVSQTVQRGVFPWSVHGLIGSQPDGLDEDCVAALNIKFYSDGARLHDITCDHKKPVLCEKIGERSSSSSFSSSPVRSSSSSFGSSPVRSSSSFSSSPVRSSSSSFISSPVFSSSSFRSSPVRSSSSFRSSPVRSSFNNVVHPVSSSIKF